MLRRRHGGGLTDIFNGQAEMDDGITFEDAGVGCE
jgi:hypothetical protein